MMQRLVVPLLAVAMGFMVAAPALAQGDPLVMVATDPTLGKILVDGKGMVLYLYSRDEKGVSNCNNQCETNWPALRPPASGEPTGAPDINGKLGVINRTDGTKQVTYNDLPLYYFARDQKAGDTMGQAVGGTWWILPPGTTTITPAVAQASPAASPAAAPAAAPAPAAKPAAAPAPAAQPAAPSQAPAAKPAAPAQAPAAAPAAKPAAAASPAAAPVQAPAAKPAAAPSPAALPRTGSLPFDPMGISVTIGAAGVALTAVGAALLRRRGRRPE